MGHFDQLCRRAADAGLALRGAFVPKSGEFDRWFSSPATVVLFGFTGASQWEHFARAAEMQDGLPDPLDRWSRRVIGEIARDFDALDFYPSGAPAAPLPFQRLALRCEPVHSSPIGLLIHEKWGLWHAYRGALVLPFILETATTAPAPASAPTPAPTPALAPAPAPGAHPCARCADRPCLSACPVGAFRPGAFDIQACVGHLRSAAGSQCRERGCLARRACPVGREFRYDRDQAAFHMQAFLRSVP